MNLAFFRTALAQAQKSLVLTAIFLYILSRNFSPLWADGDYSFRDENYEEVKLPNKPIIHMQKPGRLSSEASAHTPKIRIKSRKAGLEKVRVLEFTFSEDSKLDTAGTDRRMAVYVLDKDGLVVGYHSMKSTEPEFKILINSVINYVRIYVECYKHGLWFEEFYIRS